MSITDVGCGLCAREMGAGIKLVVDAQRGVIPLWAAGRILYYRIDERSIQEAAARKPHIKKAFITKAFSAAVSAWGDAAPIQFTVSDDPHDFEITVRSTDLILDNGSYALATAFSPTSEIAKLTLYPRLFKTTLPQRIRIFAHEIGHIFGLRHSFAGAELEPSVPFGDPNSPSIMDYNFDSGGVSAKDKSDLKLLYKQVWSGALKEIKGVKIVQYVPHHDLPPAPPAAPAPPV